MKIIIQDDDGKVQDTCWTDADADEITSILMDQLEFHFDNENEYKEHIADRWDHATK